MCYVLQHVGLGLDEDIAVFSALPLLSKIVPDTYWMLNAYLWDE